jgi:hypothetical protein
VFYLPWPPQPADKDDDDGMDLSMEDEGQIDIGVTSGADQSEWDPTGLDEEGRVDSCSGEGSSESSATQGSPPSCGVKQR